MTAPDTSANQDVASGGTIIHRKAQVGRAEHQARAMSLGKALRLTLARSADDLYDLALAAISVRFETCDNDNLQDKLDEDSLLMLLDGPTRARAAAILDPVFVGALIQQQTMGKVIRQPEGESRPLTPTDAAICAPFLDDVLARAAGMPEDDEEKRLITGYAFGAWVEDRRVLKMALEAHQYRLVHIDVDIAGGVRQGKMMLCLPLSEAEMVVSEPVEGEEVSAARPQPTSALSETVQNLNAVLRVSLARIKMPVRALGALEVGSVLDIGAADFDSVRIETIAGEKVTRGALGLIDGMRAVRLQTGTAASEGPLWQTPPRGAEGQVERQARAEDLQAALPELPDLPELGDEADGTTMALPELPELDDLPDLPEMDDLPDLPDMSDLPDFEDDVSLPKMNVG